MGGCIKQYKKDKPTKREVKVSNATNGMYKTCNSGATAKSFSSASCWFFHSKFTIIS